MRWLVLIFFTSSIVSSSNTLQWDTQYVASTTQNNSLRNSVLYTKPFLSTLSTLSAQFAARLYSSSFDAAGLGYKIELKFFPLHFLGLGVRLGHVYFTAPSYALTSVAPLSYFYFPIASWLSIRGTFGWFERFNSRTKTLVIPTFNLSNQEHDFLMDFGVELQPLSEWAFLAKIGTLEALEIYNLQNPYFEGNLVFQPQNHSWEALALFRYKVLLGFGRLDEWVAGLGIRWN